MKKTIGFCVIFFLSGWLALAAAAHLLTPAEERQYAAYTHYDDVVGFLSRLQALDGRIQVYVVGKTLENASEERLGRDLLCCVVSDPQRKGDKVLVQLQAVQHGNEQSGVDAVQKLLAGIVERKLDFLLERMDLVIFPQVNPYGNENNVRVNEQGLDMNRDHSKLETPEVEAMHRVFAALYPEVTFDMHEKGDDYVKINVGTVTNLNIDPRIGEFSHRVILPVAFKAAGDTPAREYLIQTTMDDLPSSGAVPEGLADPHEEIYRFSTTDINDGRNSFGIFNTFSFIQEISGNGDIDQYRDRSRWAFAGLTAFLRAVYDNSREIKAITAQCRADLVRRARSVGPDNLVHLRTIYARDPQQPVLKVKTYVREDAGVIAYAARDIKADEPLTRSDLLRPGRRPRVVEAEIKNWFPRLESLAACVRPLGYVVPGERRDVVSLLLKLGVKVYSFDRGGVLAVEACQVDDVIQGTEDYIPPQRIAVSHRPLQLPVKRGDSYVPLDQPAANLVPLLLEPQSDLGLIRFRAFNLAVEKGDIFPIYRVLQPPPLPFTALGDFHAISAVALGLKARN
jgi:hypothetical protein